VRLRSLLEPAPAGVVDLVPTHGDWQPRNWIIEDGILRAIDFGRFAFRPAASDFARLAAQEWRDSPACESAFFEGYGADPREPTSWRLLRAAEAVGTAAWAYHVGDELFEAQGHRMIAEVLTE
jgi:thiamine kinase-like enzyme